MVMVIFNAIFSIIYLLLGTLNHDAYYISLATFFAVAMYYWMDKENHND